MKFSTAILAVTTALASTGMARNCTPGLYYCGRVLLGIGNYNSQIIGALQQRGQPTNDHDIKDALFFCLGGANGEISWQRTCGSCQDAGGNKSDFCVGGK